MLSVLTIHASKSCRIRPITVSPGAVTYRYTYARGPRARVEGPAPPRERPHRAVRSQLPAAATRRLASDHRGDRRQHGQGRPPHAVILSRPRTSRRLGQSHRGGPPWARCDTLVTP